MEQQQAHEFHPDCSECNPSPANPEETDPRSPPATWESYSLEILTALDA